MEPSPLDLRVTIHDAPRSPGWNALWRRLLAPLPSEAARHDVIERADERPVSAELQPPLSPPEATVGDQLT